MATAQAGKNKHLPAIIRRGHTQPFVPTPNEPPKLTRISTQPNQRPPVPLALIVQKIRSCFLDGNRHIAVTEIQFCLAPFNNQAAYVAQGTFFQKKCTCPTKEPITLSYPLYDPVPFPRTHPFIEPRFESIQRLQSDPIRYNP
jgi:hypothetical protein